MLLNLKTIYQPATLEDAITLLADAGTFPLYGGAALQRNPRPDVKAAVDMSLLKLDYVRDSENNVRFGTMLTLEQMRQACIERGAAHPRLGAIAEALAAEFPETLRNTFTLGDLLVERNPQSPTLTLFLALGGVLKRVDVDMHFTASEWLALNDDVQPMLIAHVRILRGTQRARAAFEKVSRTPADLPIVGAWACVDVRSDESEQTGLALCGVARAPVAQPAAARQWDNAHDMDAALAALDLDPVGDHWGSREYRLEMARVVTQRVLLKASTPA